jgi:hypothetical protein
MTFGIPDPSPDCDPVRAEIRKEVYAEVSATLNDRVVMFEREGERLGRHYPCEIHELKMLANAYRTYAEGVGIPAMVTLRANLAAAREDRKKLKRLVKQVVLLRVYGEGSPESEPLYATWDRWEKMVENTLRNLKDKD